MKVPLLVIAFHSVKRSWYNISRNAMYKPQLVNGSKCSIIDLKSDTVTQPCTEMKERMVSAIVGDDVYGDDVNVNALEAESAKLFDKEAGLFVASGTMGNLLAVLAHTQRGDEIIVGREQHIHRWEQGNYAQYGGICAALIANKPDGTMPLDEIEASVRERNDFHSPKTTLICVENTHNFVGGVPIGGEYFASVRKIADKHNCKVHLDGARIFNAAVKLGTTVKELTKDVDSVMMCFSKGLGAPIGSIIVGTKEFIDRARYIRKGLGGGWRQAGYMAACARFALEKAEETTKKDHERVEHIISEFTKINAVNSNVVRVQEGPRTNMIFLICQKPATPFDVVEHFKNNNIAVMEFDNARVRMVLHRNITDQDVESVIEVYKSLIQKYN
uniref:Beta_elim_lyase domain-containing protein n=1 Tax=Rhabditophanes sp. KR3021 TaxID=114890 RepID=A0AC35TZM0_9BILA